MRNLDEFSVDQVQNLMNKGLVTQDEIAEYVFRWNANSHFCTLKQRGQTLVLLAHAKAEKKEQS